MEDFKKSLGDFTKALKRLGYVQKKITADQARLNQENSDVLTQVDRLIEEKSKEGKNYIYIMDYLEDAHAENLINRGFKIEQTSTSIMREFGFCHKISW